jgi:hypothetical protein
VSVERVLERAIRAPSGENTQPWRLAMRENRVRVVNDPVADRSLYNAGQRAALIAHGALLETLVLAAAAEGYEATVETFPQPGVVAEVRLDPGGEADRLADAIERRCVNRRPYDDRPLASEGRAALAGARVVEDRGTIASLAAAAAVNEVVALETRSLHDFFLRNLKDDEEPEHGVPVASLELPPRALSALAQARAWPVPPGLGERIAEGTSFVYRSCSAMAAIAVDKVTPGALVAAGRTFQRIWLAVTAAGLRLQPLTGICFLAESVRRGQAAELDEEGRRRVLDSYRVIEGTFGAGDGWVPLLFRVGAAPEPSARSGRLPLDRVLIAWSDNRKGDAR